MSKLPTKSMELMMAGWRKSNNTGMVVSFFVLPEDEAYFENATARKGKLAGQRYQTVFVQLVDGQETPDHESVKPPVPATDGKQKSHSHFPGGLCGLAIRWCDDEHFRDWLAEVCPLAKVDDGQESLTAEWAKREVCRICGVSSRKELDTVEVAGLIFRDTILKPYAEERKASGLDRE